MGRFLGSWDIDDVLRVHIQTSSVTTGAATDADSVPTWRVYEDDTATPVTTGSFTTLNSQTGFYVAAITLAAAIGYEVGKQYAIRTQATVGAVIGADVHSFQIQSKVRLAAGAITAGTITDGALTSSKFGAGFITAGSITDGAFVSSKFGAGFITAGSFSGNAIAGMPVTVGATAASAIASLVTANSIGAVTLGATVQAAIVDLVWDEPKAGHTTADTYGEYLDSTTGAIKADTAAIKLQTDTLTFTTSNSIKADIKFVNGQSVTGNGQTGTEWGPGS